MNKLLFFSLLSIITLSSLIDKKDEPPVSKYTIVIGEYYCKSCVDDLISALKKRNHVQQACLQSENSISDSLSYYQMLENRPEIEALILPQSALNVQEKIQHWPVLIKTEENKKSTVVYSYDQLFDMNGNVRKHFLKSI